MYRNAVKTYQQANFMTANPLKLVLMCYEGAIGNLKAARDAYAAGDYEKKAKVLQKTMDILHELNASLDMEKGGAIASNLRNIYNYILKVLVESDLKKDFQMFDKVIYMLEELESSWKKLARRSTVSADVGDKHRSLEINLNKSVKGVPSSSSYAGGTILSERAWSV